MGLDETLLPSTPHYQCITKADIDDEQEDN